VIVTASDVQQTFLCVTESKIITIQKLQYVIQGYQKPRNYTVFRKKHPLTFSFISP